MVSGVKISLAEFEPEKPICKLIEVSDYLLDSSSKNIIEETAAAERRRQNSFVSV